MRKTVKVTTKNNTEIISVADAKIFCKIQSNTDDTVITDLINSARASCEMYINRFLLSTVLQLQQDDFEYSPVSSFNNLPTNLFYPSNEKQGVKYVQLPYLPVISIGSVKIVDDEGTETTLTSGTDYFLDNSGRVVFSDSVSVSNMRDLAGIIINYTVGYGTTASDIPADLKLGLKMHIQNMHRGISGTIKNLSNPMGLPDGVKSIYHQHRLNNI